MDKVLRCGHEWAIALTEQLDDSDLDDVYQCILEKALNGGTFGLWLNRTFVADLLPSLFTAVSLLTRSKSSRILHEQRTFLLTKYS